MSDGGAWLGLSPAAVSGVVLLGAYHGINPGMGWLFAVALGMQDQSSRGVARSLFPIAVGHGAAIALTLFLFGVIRAVIPLSGLRVSVAVVLCGFGAYRLVRQRHPSWGGMRVGFRDLTMWSFLMASAHGAGLMLLPLLMDLPSDGSSPLSEPVAAVLTTVTAHTSSYLIVTGSVVWVVYAKLGLGLLRRAWVNLDLVWAVALIGSGVLSLAF